MSIYARVRDGVVVNMEVWESTDDPELIPTEGNDAVIGLGYDPVTGFELLPPEPIPAWINDPPVVTDLDEAIDNAFDE